MRYISLLLALIIYTTSVFSQSAPPSVKGQTDTTFQRPKPNLQLPNRQATNLGGLDTLLETGNKNRLANPGFEGTITGSSVAGWSSSLTGTATISYTAETSTFLIEGKKSLIISCAGGASGGTCTFFQDATSIAPVQYLASVYLNTSTASGFKVFSRVNGANTLSVDATNPLQPSLYKIPFTGGTTSSGIAIQMTAPASTTLQVVVDEAFVGAVDLKVDTDQSRFLGTVAYSTGGTATTGWRNFTGTGSVISGSGISFNNTTKEITLEQSGDYKIDFFISYNASTAGAGLASGLTVNGVTEQCTQVALGGSDTGPRPKNTCNLKNLPANSKIILRQYTSSSLGGDNAQVDVFRFASGSTYSSTNADTDWLACTPSSIQGFASPTYSIQCKRQGSDLIMRGRFSFTTTSAVEARLGLPVWNGSQLVSAGSSVISSLEVANGLYTRTTSSSEKGGAILIAPSISYIAFGTAFTFSGSTVTSLSPALASNVSGGNESISFNARIPIAGWENSNIIIGQFNGLESCTDTYQCTDSFSAYVDPSGVVSQENVDWINGNCSVSTSTFSCTYKSGLAGNGANLTSNMNCTLGAQNSSWASTNQITSGSTTGFGVYSTRNDSATPTATASGFFVSCQKTGADFIGKTAKAVASDQNVRTGGLTKAVMYSGTFAIGTSTPLQTYGDWIQSISSSTTGQVTFNFKTNTFASRPTCIITGYKTAGETNSYGCNIDIAATNTASAISFRCNQNNATAFNVTADILCHGYSP